MGHLLKKVSRWNIGICLHCCKQFGVYRAVPSIEKKKNFIKFLISTPVGNFLG